VTDEHRSDEGAEEAVEDLEAPAEALSDVKGGLEGCIGTCAGATKVVVECQAPTCTQNTQPPDCHINTAVVVIHEA
jgi:hypothetical protein